MIRRGGRWAGCKERGGGHTGSTGCRVSRSTSVRTGSGRSGIPARSRHPPPNTRPITPNTHVLRKHYRIQEYPRTQTLSVQIVCPNVRRSAGRPDGTPKGPAGQGSGRGQRGAPGTHCVPSIVLSLRCAVDGLPAWYAAGAGGGENTVFITVITHKRTQWGKNKRTHGNKGNNSGGAARRTQRCSRVALEQDADAQLVDAKSGENLKTKHKIQKKISDR